MRFSVIIPLYNKAPYVAKAIGSVLAQTYTDFEMVIMDDGSNDDSFEIAKKTIEGHGHCHLYREQNAGVSMARNNAVALSQGEYLCFLDADDWWTPEFLEEMSKLIDEFPEAGIYGTNYTIVNEAKHKTRVASVGVEQGFKKGYINYCKVYASTLYMPLWTGAVSIPRCVFNEMKGFPKDIKLGEDFILWVHIALKHKVVFLNRPLSFYNQDVDVFNRGTNRLHNPQNHMLWNLKDLEPLENTNEDYKLLIDNLRTYSLLPYYLSSAYHDYAQKELNKVDWNRQTTVVRRRYLQPLWLLKCLVAVRTMGSKLKQNIRHT
jgi:glycosyltransferase involved in cell wall biosynthesis